MNSLLYSGGSFCFDAIRLSFLKCHWHFSNYAQKPTPKMFLVPVIWPTLIKHDFLRIAFISLATVLPCTTLHWGASRRQICFGYFLTKPQLQLRLKFAYQWVIHPQCECCVPMAYPVHTTKKHDSYWEWISLLKCNIHLNGYLGHNFSTLEYMGALQNRSHLN